MPIAVSCCPGIVITLYRFGLGMDLILELFVHLFKLLDADNKAIQFKHRVYAYESVLQHIVRNIGYYHVPSLATQVFDLKPPFEIPPFPWLFG